MNFASDNAAGVDPAVLEAMAAAAAPCEAGYDADPWSRRLDDAFGRVFGAPCRAFAVPTGTAANALALAAVVPPWGAVLAHARAHLEEDEAGALGFFSGGAVLRLVEAPGGKLSVDALERAVAGRRGDVHETELAALSLTQATEAGTVYTVDELRALSRWAHGRGLVVHMDGARLGNAVAHLGCAPGDVTAAAGVDLLSFGAVKTGGLPAEAILVFADGLAASLPRRIKRAGMLGSKGRLAAAGLLALLQADRWLANAARANAGAARLAAAAGPARLMAPVQANSVFLELAPAETAALRAAGARFYDWSIDGRHGGRFVVAWDTPEDMLVSMEEGLGKDTGKGVLGGRGPRPERSG